MAGTNDRLPRSFSANGVLLTEKHYSSGLRLPLHNHESAYFCLVLAGQFTETCGRHSRLGRASTLFYHPPGETHSDDFHRPTRCLDIEIVEGPSSNASQMSQIPGVPMDFFGGRMAFLAARIYREFCSPDKVSSLMIEGLALELIAESGRRASTGPERIPPLWLKQIKESLHDQFGEHITLTLLAQRARVHPTHLARQFQKFYKCSVGEYLRRLRLEFACQQISTSDASLSEIALTAGFFDQSHFARTFKTYTGFTPGQYRLTFRHARRIQIR